MPRGSSQGALEQPLQVRLIREADASRDLGNVLTPAQAIARKFEAAINQVPMRRKAMAHLESTDQIGGRKLYG